jgi:light-regulated signal transduction histidine kinase (bacteriophytochrome)
MAGNEPITQETLLHRMTNAIRQSLELQEILSATAAEIRAFLQTDRVKVYRFQPDGSGQVIAESIHDRRLPSLLGLYFPAHDIPPAAREMFVKARQRSIVNVPEQKIILSRTDYTKTTGDLTIEDVQHQAIADILQRPVDPCHVDYLTAMGVQSSLVVPIFYQHQLWGLIASHHAEAKAFSETDLQIVQLLADQVSVAIAQSQLLTQARNKARREALVNQISTLLHAPLQIQDILQTVLEQLVRAAKGSGGRLYLRLATGETANELYVYGRQPYLPQSDWLLEEYPFWQQFMKTATVSIQPLDELSTWATSTSPFLNTEASFVTQDAVIGRVRAIADLYQTPELESISSVFRPTPIRSLLIMPLHYGAYALGCLTVFRNEADAEVLWAGRYDQDVRQDRVRESFAAWRELKRGQVHPWTPEDIELVRSLGTHITMAVMQNRLYQCEREQRLLVEMRNQELSTARSTAEEASRLKSNFLSSTSHELRTPLASILNYLRLLKEGFYDNPEELQEYIDIAYRSAENLVAILNDVLDIAKIEAGRMAITCEPIHLPQILQEQAILFRPESRRRGIALIITCDVEIIETDLVKLRQVLTNLLSNAFKFTTQGEVRLRAVQRIVNQHPVVEISVADTGIGIDIDNEELLFEPFVQADGSIKRRYGGTGLGLTVCKRLIELMGGYIWLDSPGKGQGTIVTFTLPLTPPLPVDS